MTDPAIIEAAEKALQDFPHEHIIADDYSYMAEALIAAVTPLIEEAVLKRWHHDLAYVRSAALEEAARIAMDHPSGSYQVGIAIRALKEQP